MKKTYLFFLLVFMAIKFNAHAERVNIPGLEVPKLIITEVRPDSEADGYVELTNVGDTPIDLEPFTLHSVHYNTRIIEVSDSIILFNRANAAVEGTIGKVYLKGILQPGESFVISTVWDGQNARISNIPNHNIALAQKSNQFVFKEEPNNTNGWILKPEWQCFGFDSVSSPVEQLRAESSAGYLIHWKFQVDSVTIDSTYIDQFNFFHFPDLWGQTKGHDIFPIAGVADAMTTGIMVRKAQVDKGNLNWDQSRGADAFNSEWIVIPKNSSKTNAFTTVGVHGVFDLDYTVKNPSNIILDETAKTISIPWQMVRGDSLSNHFTLGEGMGWSYEFNEVFEDSAAYIARTGDRFSFHAAGNEPKSVEYTLQVREPEADLALIFPRRRLLFTPTFDGTDTIMKRSWSTGFVYALAQGPEIDSIINVPFATRVDSLLKYLDKPEKAKLEFVFVDGLDRVDLKFGDKVRVTSENGSAVKDYFVAVNDHVKNNNALLSTVTWPDVNKSLYPRWIVGDTLPDFSPFKTQYVVELRHDAKKFPAFQYIPQDLRSRIEVKNAVDVDGTIAQRTTSVTVYAESDTTFITYNFIFEKQGVPVQPNDAEPFISELVRGLHTQGFAVEIFNPGTEELDLSRYMYIRGNAGQTWQEAVETLVDVSAAAFGTGDGLKIYKTHYVPSKRWAADGSVEEWAALPNEENPYVGRGFLKDDNETDPWVKGGDVWVMGTGINATSSHQIKIRQESDFIFRGSDVDNTRYAWGDSTLILHRETPPWTWNNTWLLKVLNDSILNGTKDVRDASAYELIDRFDAVGDSLAGKKLGGWMSLIRKPSVSRGNVERMGGANETPESSEWIFRTNDPGVNLSDNVGIHVMDPITNFLSTVTSLKLLVTPGYKGDNLSITGNIVDFTPATISMVLEKADSSQTFVFKRGATVLADDQTLADADILEVTSGDGRSITNYKLINSPLDDNTSLTAKAGSGLTVSDNKVSGVTMDMTLKQVLANLEVANKSVLNVINLTSGALQPLALLGLDSLKNDILVSDKVILEVVAENNDKATYSFDFGFASTEAILFSNILKIDQDKKWILDLPENSTVSSMLMMVYANEGATIKIMDKEGFAREIGFLNIDDEIEVTAPDGVTKVLYKFSEWLFTSVDRTESLSNVSVYPNPVSYVLNIEGLELASLEVYSISGQLMISQYSYDRSLNVSSLPAGVYIIRMIDTKGMVATRKFLKK